MRSGFQEHFLAYFIDDFSVVAISDIMSIFNEKGKDKFLTTLKT